MCEVNTLEIEKFNFLNKLFPKVESLKSALGALFSKTHKKYQAVVIM
jgi:hypothetical protein